LLLVSVLGCGGRGAKPVKGIVTLEGNPVAGATVVLMPEGDGRPASGCTDSHGAFQLMTFQPGDGAMPGAYRVVINKTMAAPDAEAANRSATERAERKFKEVVEEEERKNAGKEAGKPSLLPKIYASFATTPLRLTVPTSGPADFDLKKDGGK
jgi:hypothetical protein